MTKCSSGHSHQQEKTHLQSSGAPSPRRRKRTRVITRIYRVSGAPSPYKQNTKMYPSDYSHLQSFGCPPHPERRKNIQVTTCKTLNKRIKCVRIATQALDDIPSTFLHDSSPEH